MESLSIKVEFGGGLELLFDNQRSHQISIPSLVPVDGADDSNLKPTDVKYLIDWLKTNRLRERPELFVEEGTVRPGILVLINDTDWELEGETDYQLKNNDEVVFISTLHGG